MSCDQERELAEANPHHSNHSIYERAFGSDMDPQRMPAPWPQHGDLLDDRDREEMLYHHQMAMAAQNRARYASYTARLHGESYHRGPTCPPDYHMHPIHGSHQDVMMAHAAASRRTRNERGYPFDLPYAVNRRMMYTPFMSEGRYREEELAYGIPPHGALPSSHGAMCRYPAATQAIDIDFGVGKVGRKPTEVKKELVIFPRRKAGQSKRQADNEAPVKLTPESLEEIANIPLVAAAKKLGISKTALKNACRNLGLKRWPFRRRREDARRKAAIASASLSSSDSTRKTSPSESDPYVSAEGGHGKSPLARGEGDEVDSLDEQDSESSGDEVEDDDEQGPRPGQPAGADVPSSSSWQHPRCASYREDDDKSKAVDGDLMPNELVDACILAAGKSSEGKSFRRPFILSDGDLATGTKKQESGKLLRGGGETPPEQRQSLSRAGSQDEDDLFNVGCNHTASEMWTSLGDARPEYHLHVMGYDEPPPWGLHPYSHQLLHAPKASTSAGTCTEAEKFLIGDHCDDLAMGGEAMAMAPDFTSRSARLSSLAGLRT